MNKKYKTLIAVIITLVLGYFILRELSFEDVKQTLANISWFSISIVTIIYFLVFLLRSYQKKALLKKRISIRKLFGISSLHNFFNMLIPARLGELSLVYYLREEDVSATKSLSMLLLIRITDIISTILIFFVALLMANELFFEFQILSILLFVLLFALVILSYLLFYKASILLNIFNKTLDLFRLKLSSLRTFVKKCFDALEVIKDKKKLLRLLLLSLIIWALKYFIYVVILHDLNIVIGFWPIIISATAVVLISILPFYSIGGFGTIEGTFSGMLIVFGIATSLAIATALTVHIIMFLNYILFGIIGLLILRVRKLTF